MYLKETIGTIPIANNVTLTANDILPICLIPQNSFLAHFTINFPIVNPSGTTLTISLLDSLASPTTYILNSSKGTNFQALTTFSMVDVLQAVMGTQYATTARSIGASGAPVVVWTAGVQLRLKVTGTASAANSPASNITYICGFAPVYDAGV